MTLGSWNPDSGRETVAYTPDPALLAACAAFAEAGDWPGLSAWVAANLPADANQMMKLEASQWQGVLHGLDQATLLALVRFFTVAEHQMSHWHGGDKSPVIWLSRELKRRGHPLDRDQVLWIKSNTDNRFLPHGPLL